MDRPVLGDHLSSWRARREPDETEDDAEEEPQPWIAPRVLSPEGTKSAVEKQCAAFGRASGDHGFQAIHLRLKLIEPTLNPDCDLFLICDGSWRQGQDWQQGQHEPTIYCVHGSSP
jgi:hypothetical protein